MRFWISSPKPRGCHRRRPQEDPDTLTDTQQATLRLIRRHDSATWRAYQLKESLRDIVTARDIDEHVAATALDRCVAGPSAPASNHSSSSPAPSDCIATIPLGWNNGRVEGLNNRVRLIYRGDFGFHSAEAVAALVILSCGPVTLRLPNEPTAA